MTVDIICADARDALARFPDGHFHCCVTSPPFWGLRDYGLEPTVWGGDDCEHEWVDDSVKVERGAGNWTQAENGLGLASGKPQTRFRGDLVAARANTEYAIAVRGFCRRCNAWRGTLGLEPTPELYVEHLVAVMREVRRVLRPDGTLWLNLGDSYTSIGRSGRKESPGVGATQEMAPVARSVKWQAGGGSNFTWSLLGGQKPKDLVGVPWMVAFALRADGWWLREENIWYKKNPMPESVQDRNTRSHEQVFRLTKSAVYYADQDAIREPHKPDSHNRDPNANPERQAYEGVKAKGYEAAGGRPHRIMAMRGWAAGGRNKRSVWEIATQPFGLEMCAVCRTIYTPAQYRRLRGGSAPRCTYEIGEDDQCCGTKWLAQDGGAVCVSCETFYSAKELERLPRAAKCRKCGSEEWLSHFAVFPEKLVEPCILAGTSERGCCPECGAPWERVVETTRTGRTYERGACSADHRAIGQPQHTGAGSGALSTATETTGWRPTCKHGAEPVPCRVLDPFAGSGTVGLVAERLGRHSVLIDAKEEYCEMARHRTAQRGLMVEAAS